MSLARQVHVHCFCVSSVHALLALPQVEMLVGDATKAKDVLGWECKYVAAGMFVWCEMAACLRLYTPRVRFVSNRIQSSLLGFGQGHDGFRHGRCGEIPLDAVTKRNRRDSGYLLSKKFKHTQTGMRASSGSDWTAIHAFETTFGAGLGMAVSPASDLLVTSDCFDDTLTVWRLPVHARHSPEHARLSPEHARRGDSILTRVCSFGGAQARFPMQFQFRNVSGNLAFVTVGDSAPLLLVTDAGNHAVHFVDVWTRRHCGYLVVPGAMAWPRGVAATSEKSPLVAVSAWEDRFVGQHVVKLFAHKAITNWEVVRVIGGLSGHAPGQLCRPNNLRFSRNGSTLCVSENGNACVSVFRIGEERSWTRLASGNCLYARDMVEVGAGHWAVASFGCNIEVWSEHGGQVVATLLCSMSSPNALAFVPGMGLLGRAWNGTRLLVFATGDMVAMGAMSEIRVAWMAAAA